MRRNFELRSLGLNNCRAENLPRLRLPFTRDQKLQRRTHLAVPNFRRIHAIPTIHDVSAQQEIDRRARAAYRRISLVPQRFTITTALRLRAKIKRPNEILSGPS